jgi:hypothetical protein
VEPRAEGRELEHVSGGRNATFSALPLALPFTLERDRDHFTVGPHEGPLGEFAFFRERAFGPQRKKTYELRLSNTVELDGPSRRSKVIKWCSGNHGSIVIEPLHVWSLGDRYISPGDVIVTDEANLVRLTINTFNWSEADEPSVSVCRDAWLSGQRQQAEEIARSICPQTWPALIAACEIDRQYIGRLEHYDRLRDESPYACRRSLGN